MENTKKITLKQARDMIGSIDTSLIPECRDFDNGCADSVYLTNGEAWPI